MMNKLIYCSYATAATPYVEVIQSGLIPSLEKFKLHYEISYPKSLHDWTLNTQIKAQVIYDMLMKHKCPIVMLDADAEIVDEPTFFNELTCDLSFHNLDTGKYWRNNPSTKREPLTGTMFINYNEKTLKLINAWIVHNYECPTQHDMNNFGETLAEHKDLNIEQLPIEYVTIIKKDGTWPDFIVKPVIKHYQKSRLYRGFRQL